jgi:conjugative relaxase-like TrwC/TraI family protein
MGVDAVAYHRETVVGREDDHPGRAMDYYASRGETPLRWAGAEAARLGLSGEVTPEDYEAAFGPGGFRDPTTGQRLVRTTRPGIEIVVAAHKTVALLGVIGRAEDMHAILDVENDATMDHLEGWFQARGGRRGRAEVVAPTTGFVYATTRHGTSRAGDPSPHDHNLVANITRMLDAIGGHKGLRNGMFAGTVEAATMVGRLHSAYRAVQLGYAIEPDPGPSGRLRHWRIKGIPQVACDTLSKRSDEIGEYLSDQGYVGYRAANIAARKTRDIKRHTGVDQLMGRWHQELAEIGWPIDRLNQALDAARAAGTGVAPPLTAQQVDQITAGLMDPDGPFLARGKVFTRTRLIAEVAPLLYGHDPAELEPVLDHIIASPLVTPLIGVARAVEQPFTATAVLATEHTIANTIQRLIAQAGPRLDPARVPAAIAAKQDQIGAKLSDGQQAAVNAVCTSGRAVDVIVGIAGSGKATALNAATTPLEQAGYRVIGTATAGQAARTLGDAAGIEARTLRSLMWQLDHGRIVLDRDAIVILDEASMTADADMARLVLAVEAAGAKVVIVGDDRQLSPVGPGGALHQTLAAHPQVVTTLTENLRQRDPAERDALLELRAGDLDTALRFYAANERITTAPERTHALAGIVDAWAADTAAGHDTFMLAWRRQSVADLNRIARAVARHHGWLTGPDIHTADGRPFAVGDIVVTLAPNYRGQLVTSERATITAIDHQTGALTIRTDHGQQASLSGPEIDPDHLAHGYALTVHREQGATSDRTHYLAEGGGRELAYVALSRARDRTTVHAVADDLDQALDDIAHDWSHQQHDTWLTPTTSVGEDPRVQPAGVDRETIRRRLVAELDRLHAMAPPDVTRDLTATLNRLDALQRQREHLADGTGPYRTRPIGRIVRQLHDLDTRLDQARAHHAQARPWQRPRWQRHIGRLENHQAVTLDEYHQHVAPEARRLDTAIARTTERADQLHG